MTHDTDYPRQTVEEREHSVFVPPNEQHLGEDGTPTEAPQPAETPETPEAAEHDADRVDAIGTEGVPHAPEADADQTRMDQTHMDHNGADQMDRDAVPATPLDTGTAEDVGRFDESNNDTPVEGTLVDVTDGLEEDRGDGFEDDGVQEIAAEDEARAVGTAPVPGHEGTPPGNGLWPSGLVDDLRGRWDAVQMRFVDDPSGVATDAKTLVGEAVTAMRDAVDRLEARLEEAATQATDDTEQLRQRVAHYRDVFESLLSR